ncbi:MAG: glycoside hydrolase family protein [Planctomycetota bacterium]
MYIACTADFKKIEHHTLKLDLNQDYLRKHFDAPWLVARDIWGFVPYKHTDSSWHAYASIHIGGYKTFICHFTPNGGKSWPITDWKLDKVIVAGRSKSAYESKVYSDNTGLYLIYVETLADGSNHIMAQKLLDPETIDNSFKARAILSPEGLRSEDRNQPGSMQIVEGPNISHVITPEGSKYVMFYAVGDFVRNNYKLGVAYSDVLIPPKGEQYQKPKAMDKLNLWSNPVPEKEVVYLLQSQLPGWYNFAGKILQGPGLGNLVKYKDNYYSIFHAHDVDKSRGRWVWMCPVEIDFTKSMDLWLVPQLAN